MHAQEIHDLKNQISNSRKPAPNKKKEPIVSDLCRYSEAVQMLGSRTLLDRAVKAKWLKPCVQQVRLTIFRHTDVLLVCEKILAGNLPPL